MQKQHSDNINIIVLEIISCYDFFKMFLDHMNKSVNAFMG